MNKDLVIGITGGIGSGKSTIMNILKNDYNAFVLETDVAGHIVMNPGGLAYDDVILHFGKDILNDDMTINRKALGNIVFNDSEKLKLLNSIIHPNVKKYITHQIEAIQNTYEASLIFIESALLLDDNYDRICDYIWYVYSDYETRFVRVNASRNMERKRFDEIIANQLPDHILREKCDVIIDNSGNVEETKKQIEFALNKLTKED